MRLNSNSKWNTCHGLDTDKVISEMFAISDTDYYVGVVNSNTCYNVTSEHVQAFYDAKERMEREVKEAELRKTQIQNKRLRAMVKKVIFSGDRTIIMWNDGTKTVTQCHELDAYDKEKGILACMAKKLYKNTNLFNEVVRAYVPEETGMSSEKQVSIAETIKQQKLRIEYLEEQLEREAWARRELAADLRYLEDVKEELAEENRSLRDKVEDCLEQIEWLEELENRLDQ